MSQYDPDFVFLSETKIAVQDAYHPLSNSGYSSFCGPDAIRKGVAL